jgi:hypothetical protein
MKSEMASAGTRTLRPQFTRGSFRLTSQARIVVSFTARRFAASGTVSNSSKGPSALLRLAAQAYHPK